MDFIKRIIIILKSIIKKNKIEYYKTNIVDDKQAFAIKINDKILMMEGKINKINGFDFPYEAKKLKNFEDKRIWEKTKKKKFVDEYNGNIGILKKAIKTLKSIK